MLTQHITPIIHDRSRVENAYLRFPRFQWRTSPKERYLHKGANTTEKSWDHGLKSEGGTHARARGTLFPLTLHSTCISPGGVAVAR